MRGLLRVLSAISHLGLFATAWTTAPRLICPGDSPGTNTGVGGHALLQGVFPEDDSRRLWASRADTLRSSLVSAQSWRRAWVGAVASTAPSSPVTVAQGDKADPACMSSFLLFSCILQPDCLGSHQPSAAHL